jgi:GNAT superfamily N-acetyltransferase
MSVWFEGANEIECNIQQMKQAIANLGEHYVGVISLMPGLTSVETDLFFEKAYRRRGIGTALQTELERAMVAQGIKKIWTRTAGYEEPDFYHKQGYRVFTEQENWYSNGNNRIGLRKDLLPSG